ncbi:MAG: hypothetical protein ACFFBD_17150, partial [Candidatus Hodarchaeota archaeon]
IEDKKKIDSLTQHLERFSVKTSINVVYPILKLENISDRIEFLSEQYGLRINDFVEAYRQTISDLISRVEASDVFKRIDDILETIEIMYRELDLNSSEAINTIRELEYRSGRLYSRSEVRKMTNEVYKLFQIMINRERGGLPEQVQMVKQNYERDLRKLADSINGTTSFGSILHVFNEGMGIYGLVHLCERARKGLRRIINTPEFKISIRESPPSQYHLELIQKSLNVDLREKLASVSKEDREILAMGSILSPKGIKESIEEFLLFYNGFLDKIPEDDEKAHEIINRFEESLDAFNILLERPHLHEMESQRLYYFFVIDALISILKMMKTVPENPKPKQLRTVLHLMDEMIPALFLFREFYHIASRLQRVIMDRQLHAELLIFPLFQEIFSYENLKPFDLKRRVAITPNTLKKVIKQFYITHDFISTKISSTKSLGVVVEEINESLKKLAEVKKRFLHYTPLNNL